MTEETDLTRRHFLTVATATAGVVGVAFAAAPFVASFRPSARARALGAPIEVDVSKVSEGSMLKVEWRGQPVWVLHRTQAMLDTLEEIEPRLRDPESNQSEQPEHARNRHRSERPEFLVVIGSCTHLGCAPIERFEIGPADLGRDWKGGFFCPCHGSSFDLAGRVFSGVPAPTNLTVPPHTFTDDRTLLIGSETGAA